MLDVVQQHLANMSQVEVFGLAALLGLAAHLGIFIRGEWHIHGPAVVLGHVSLVSLTMLGELYFQVFDFNSFFQATATFSLGYCAALFTSIVIYRIYFHPLARAGFTGPLSLRLTKLTHAWACRRGQNHLLLLDLHANYGDFVRTGPSEITVFHPDVYKTIDGPKNQCMKSDWYDILHPNLALVTCRAKESHRARRRQWTRGFSQKAVETYEAKTLTHVDELDECIEADARMNQASDVTDLIQWFAFDAMGDFVFSKSFNMLKDRRWHHIIGRFNGALNFLGPMSPVPWLAQIGFKLMPRVGILDDWFKTIFFCEQQMRERVMNVDGEPDVAHYLFQDAKSNGFRKEDWMWLSGDSLFAIVAGSDPVSSILVNIFNEITKAPEHAEKIYQEVRKLDCSQPKSLQKPVYLNCVINEVLRLHPVLPTGGNRKTLEEIEIAGVKIPRNTTIVGPRHTISRREDCFEKADQFIPERWNERPEMIRNKAAYVPFGTGNHTCLGRFMAMDEIRMVVAMVVKKYTMHYAPGETGDRVQGDMVDRFTACPGRLRLLFELREENPVN